MIPTRMERADFVALAERILGDQKTYEHPLFTVRRNYNGLDLQVTRQPMPAVDPGLAGTNPVTMVKAGEIIRHHGEHCFIVEAMLEAAGEL